MGWYDLSDNQTVSFANLRDASLRGVFQRLTTIPNTNEEIIKTDVTTYVNVQTGYQPFVDLTNLQLPIKTDLQPANSCSVTMPFFCQKSSAYYDATKDFVYTYNMGGTSGGIVTVTLSDMTRNLQNESYPGEVAVYYDGVRQMSQLNAATCFNGSPAMPAVIPGGAVNPGNRTIYFAVPAQDGALTVVIACGGANSNFTLTGTVTISCVDISGWSCTNNEQIYFAPGGRARFNISGPGDFDITINQVGADGQVLGIYNSSGGQDSSIGPIDSGYCGVHSLSTISSSYFEIREVSSPAARPAFTTVQLNGCPVEYVDFVTYGPNLMQEYSYYDMAVTASVAVNTAVNAEVYWYGDLGGYLYSNFTIPSAGTCDGNLVSSGSQIDPAGEYFSSFSTTLDPSSSGSQVFQVTTYSTGAPPC